MHVFLGGTIVKNIQKVISSTLFVLLIISTIAIGAVDYSSLAIKDTDEGLSTIPPLRNVHISPYFISQFTNKEEIGRISPAKSLSQILNGTAPYTFFSGDIIRFVNRFTIPGQISTNYALLNHSVSIFLIKKGTLNPTDPTYFFKTATTNGTQVGKFKLTENPDEGFIDTTITVPDLTSLELTYGILPGDDVTIYQYLAPSPGSGAEGVPPYAYTDNFTLSAFPTLSIGTGFVNPASGDNEFRQGEDASFILTALSGSDPINNASISATIHYNSSEVQIANTTGLGIICYLRDVTTGLPRTTTDSNGQLRVIVVTTYPTTTEDNFFINITGDFIGTSIYSPDIPQSRYANNRAQFTINNEMDTASITIVSVIPSDFIRPPNENFTVLTVRIAIVYAYTGATYYIPNIPVQATLDTYPTGVSLSIASGFSNNGSGWALTDSSGYVKFNITSGFPIPYQLKTPTITVKADLANPSAPGASYPSGPPNAPHRFIRGSSGEILISDSQMISIDPEFLIGQIGIYSYNASIIRPGEDAVLEFEVNSSQSPSTNFVGVPVKFGLNQPIAGVSLSISGYTPYGNGYYLTDANGRIKVTVSSTYLLTPEIIKNVILDITIDFENDSNVRWMGTLHSGTATFAEYDKSWSTSQYTGLTINPRFVFCDIIFSSTNETIGDTTRIRPGDGLEVTFKVQEQGTGTVLGGVPVNVSLMSNYAGVSISIGSTHGGAAGPNYYYSSGAGLVSIILSTTYGITPKTLLVQLNATADFANDLLDVWHIGQIPSSGDFRSNYSYSSIIQDINVDPQYFTGIIIISPNNPPDTIIPQTDTFDIEYQLRLRFLLIDYLSSISNIVVSILVNNSDPSVFNMTVIPSISQVSSASSVSFQLQTNTTGETPEGKYNITARADFGGGSSLIYNITHPTVPTGKLAGYWVNGSHTTAYSYKNYIFEVKNIDRIVLQVTGVSDPNYTDEGYNASSGYYEVYRSTTTITIFGSYKDDTLDPVQGRDILLAYDYPGLSSPVTLTTVTTNTLGEFSQPITLPTTTPLRDIIIFGRDTTNPIPQEKRENITNIRVVSTISLADYSLSSYTGSAIYAGETVTASGTLIDDQGVLVTSGEVTDHLRVVGWDGSTEVGIAVVSSPVSGTYSINYQIPSTYTGSTLNIRLNVTSHTNLIHFRPTYTQIPLNVYNEIQLNNWLIYLPVNGGTISLTNGSTFIIPGVLNKTIEIRGELQDQASRSLDSKNVRDYWNATTQLRNLGAPATFNFPYDFPGYTNVTMIWQLYHITDEGTILTKKFYITLKWEVYDETAPVITVISPTGLNSSALPNNPSTIIVVDVIDPSTGIVSVGLNSSSVYIFIDGFYTSMTQTDVNEYSFTWDTSSVTDKIYTMFITANDFAGNLQNITLLVVIDVLTPVGTLEIDLNSNNYVNITSGGDAIISGTLTEAVSTTGRTSGLDESTIFLQIVNNTGFTVVNRLVTLTGGLYEERWSIILNADDLETMTRNPTFQSASENWKIRLIYSDLAGNSGFEELDVKLDNNDPVINIEDNPRPNPDDPFAPFNFSISLEDLESGINYSTLYIQILNQNRDQVIETVTSSELSVKLNISEGVAQVTYDSSGLTSERIYHIRAHVFDNTGNHAIKDDGEGFSIQPRPSTTTTPTTTNPPNGGPSLGGVDLLVFIIFDVLALGGGVFLALVYEKYRKPKIP